VKAGLVKAPGTVSMVECKRREESRRGTQKCVRHALSAYRGLLPLSEQATILGGLAALEAVRQQPLEETGPRRSQCRC
jgi:hypothetical protein